MIDAIAGRRAMSRTNGLSTERLARMDDLLRGHVARGAVAGLVALVARRDAVHVAADAGVLYEEFLTHAYQAIDD
jgi:hypothetical protein